MAPHDHATPRVEIRPVIAHSKTPAIDKRQHMRILCCLEITKTNEFSLIVVCLTSVPAQAAPPSKDEVTPLLAADTLSPEASSKPAVPSSGPTSVAEQLDAMKPLAATPLPDPKVTTLPDPKVPTDKAGAKDLGSGSTEAAQAEPEAVPPDLEGFAKGTGVVSKDATIPAEPQNPISDSVPGTEIAPSQQGNLPLIPKKDCWPPLCHEFSGCKGYTITQGPEILSTLREFGWCSFGAYHI